MASWEPSGGLSSSRRRCPSIKDKWVSKGRDGEGFSSWSSIMCKHEAEEHGEVPCAGEGVRRRGVSHVVQGLHDSD